MYILYVCKYVCVYMYVCMYGVFLYGFIYVCMCVGIDVLKVRTVNWASAYNHKKPTIVRMSTGPPSAQRIREKMLCFVADE